MGSAVTTQRTFSIMVGEINSCLKGGWLFDFGVWLEWLWR
jgi:hypothetical protein